MELIIDIQARIEAIYGVSAGVAAGDYLIDHSQLLQLLPAQQSTVFPKELLLVSPNPAEDAVEIALFLNDELCDNLRRNDPLERISKKNLSDFCTLIEGVSHFVYYLHKATLARPVTQLEMELQAEIDKFVLLSTSAESQTTVSAQLIDMLFEDYSLLEQLNPEETERYRTANNLARKYCHRLLPLVQRGDTSAFLRDIRDLYALGQEDKIRRILL